MTLISNDPSWWPTISFFRGGCYVDIACLIVVVYDWALTVGQEVELIWATLVPHDCPISWCTIHWNTIFNRGTDRKSRLDDRCRVSEIIVHRLAGST
ncbi:hypothetical protein K503DRAFT_526231 [Rhizopogon vinicolor AM-OR11-026]|uniref:DUF6533 domain-containing protein n=1 Tax=Rhizopogon vinicolor AM-OR11-026 TaxID=1314800 RepID=A0A1B7MLD9_9AGAM|nr:hypothetical protein K503DRAFT_526231 [Rhizopogon vinicolor AM-OR11-026]